MIFKGMKWHLCNIGKTLQAENEKVYKNIFHGQNGRRSTVNSFMQCKREGAANEASRRQTKDKAQELVPHAKGS